MDNRISKAIKKLKTDIVSHDGDQIVVSHHAAQLYDEWLEKQGFSYEGRGVDPNTHIYSLSLLR